MLNLYSMAPPACATPACRRACGAPSSSGRAAAAATPRAPVAPSRAVAAGAARRCPFSASAGRRPTSSSSSSPPRATPETAEAAAAPQQQQQQKPQPAPNQQQQQPKQQQPPARSLVDRVTGGLGDALGPIGLTYGGDAAEQGPAARKVAAQQKQQQRQGGGPGVALGPISLSFGGDGGVLSSSSGAENDASSSSSSPSDSLPPQSIARLTTAEWRERYEREDGTVDLWLEDEFNAGSRLVGGRAVHWGGVAGFGSGEGPSAGGDVPLHRVVIRDSHYGNATFDIQIPEDRYVLFEAEAQGLELPYACRMGCCTACAVRVLEGELAQPQALGVSAELRAQGYALMCVAYPTSDCVVETVSEDEIYEKQFGRAFAEQALDPTNPAYVARDDFALEVALGDE